jgi:hypothetical protein
MEARLKLYKYLDLLKERASNSDTDSLICIQKCGEPPAVTCGDKLGDMTNELGSDEYKKSLCQEAPRSTPTKL